MDKLEQAREALDRIEAAIHELAGEVAPGGPEDRAWAAINDAREALAALSLPVEGVKGEPRVKPSYQRIIEIVQSCVRRMQDAGESHRMLARWVSSEIDAEIDALASPEAEARLRERVEPTWRAGQYANPLDKNAFKWLIFCDAWQTSIASGLTKEAAEEIARAHNDALAEAAEARLAQAERVPAVTEADLRALFDAIRSARRWFANDPIIAKLEKAKEIVERLQAALQQSAAGEEGKP